MLRKINIIEINTIPKTLSYLAGHGYGNTIWQREVKDKFKEDSQNIIFFPEHIERVCKNFIEGLFQEILNNYSSDYIKKSGLLQVDMSNKLLSINDEEYSSSIYDIPPGETIKELMEEKNLSISQFSKKLDMSQSELSDLLIGKIKINKDIAIRLGKAFKIPMGFWLKLEDNYRKDIQ